MYDYMLYEMASVVSKKCGIRLDDAFNALMGYWQDKIACPWNVDDILAAARRAGKPIIRTDAIELLKQVFDQYDPELGITQQTLDVALENYHLRFDSLSLDTCAEVHGVFKVWRDHPPIARHFGRFPDKVSGNLLEALAFAQGLSQGAPDEAVFVGCAFPESSQKTEPWLVVLFENEQCSITEGVNHVRMD